MVGKTKAPTAAQERRMKALSHMRCIACELAGVARDCGHVEVHHLVDKGTRKHSGGHDATIPLGSWHHRGLLKSGWTALEMRSTFGPSMALEGRKFTATFGTQRELLAKVDARLLGDA